MIKTTLTLTCDRCGREIKAGDRYYVEDIDLHHFSWDGEGLDGIAGEDMERRTRDLCEECRVGLYDPKGKLAESTTEEMQAFTTPATVAADELDLAEAPFTQENGSEATELPMTENVTAKEVPLVGEDVETGEAVELGGKTYTEYQLEPEPTPETREVAERIVAMGEKAEKKQKKRLTDAQKEQIVRMMQGGTTMDKVAKTVGCSPQTVCNVWHKYNAIQEVQDGR